MPISSLALLLRFSTLNFSFNQTIKNPTLRRVLTSQKIRLSSRVR